MSGIQNLPSEQTVSSRSPKTYVNTKALTWEGSATAVLTGHTGTLTGVLAVDTWKSIVSVTGAGVLNWARIQTGALSATAGTFSYRVVIDGVGICSGSTTSVSATTGVDLVGISNYIASVGWGSFNFDQVPFSQSMSIDVKHSAGETDKRTVYAQYRTV